MKYFIFSVLVIALTVSCLDDVEPVNPDYEFELPSTPFNLESFNTEFDDYNSAAPRVGDVIAFCFSTNRKSQGNKFDIIFEPMNIFYDRFKTKELSVTTGYPSWYNNMQEFQAITYGLRKITNDSANELGPYIFLNNEYRFDDFSALLLYATDLSGNFDIHFTYSGMNNNINFFDTSAIDFLNSEKDDLYPCFDFNSNKMFFCSNRDGDNFNIYEVEIDNPNKTLIPILTQNNNNDVILSTKLSSDYDDKCPFIYDNTLVFTSNRPGGFGGYDLYYCKLENGIWSDPVNFGAEINTEFDEYRPILFEEGIDYTKHAMVFSSNRTGGKGGFDLYMVGVDN